ncbi:uncharacterized protein LOC125159013 isoform X2 [Prionailurus viverrinus]|uniref:uncharacterized protein LOC125159013 isoform X1 n=1 Tax=Prionailurus viverrinus TaxID=61388 RepID=UPI001FF15A97|nr:uncharacterized protein LOC125159013 isoform X1 [Prionailurus viverrinus]XP_047702731.1 uncharacterized protein LOC125159013 isoform X2 [Prionailurus viverrinus]
MCSLFAPPPPPLRYGRWGRELSWLLRGTALASCPVRWLPRPVGAVRELYASYRGHRVGRPEAGTACAPLCPHGTLLPKSLPAARAFSIVPSAVHQDPAGAEDPVPRCPPRCPPEPAGPGLGLNTGRAVLAAGCSAPGPLRLDSLQCEVPPAARRIQAAPRAVGVASRPSSSAQSHPSWQKESVPFTHPAVTRSAVTLSVVTCSMVTRPTVIHSGVTCPAVTRPRATDPVGTCPTDTHSGGTRPADTRPGVARPTVTCYVGTCPVVTHPGVTSHSLLSSLAHLQPLKVASTGLSPGLRRVLSRGRRSNAQALSLAGGADPAR